MKDKDLHAIARWLSNSLMHGGFTSWGGMGLNMLGYAWWQWLSSLAFSMGGACFLGGVFPISMALGMGGFFAKASDGQETHSRYLPQQQRRRCSKSKCLKAAQTLREKNLQSASSGGCQLSLHNSKDKVVAKEIPDQTLQKAVHSILATCGEKNTHPKDNKPAHIDERQVAMLLSKH
ncbi:hypothetical protein PTTG_29332 [Puccinia triticina 1-1 BBBD Race 1]|uniref:Uncharacterized protein n=1 Tax=Puccinia triticina (isolate 1-1 / race 1 (BBBD)) TaxID=630390 RepID=A0A180G6Z9_PUCT1|nr:hypothetical protein PTTG_29332 [Puccinia triticina 1-1 BBBD Race 1]